MPRVRLFQTLLLALAPLAWFAAAAAPPARAAAPEVRGTWLTTTGTDHISSGNNTAAVMADLRNIGLNTAYVETWAGGYTMYPSATLKALIGTTDRSPFLGSTRDLVQETLIQAHRNGMEYFGWFEYGAMTQYVGAGGNPNNPLSTYMKNRGWLLKNQSGQYADSTNGGFAYMNIAVPEVRQFLINMTLEAVNRYDLDGIQYDDHMAWPVNFGFDATSLALYTAETGNAAPTSPTSAPFSAWRQQKVTDFAAEMKAAVKAARPDMKFASSPSITTFSTTQYNANWPAWEAQGLFDEYAIQMYRDNLTSFNSIVNAQTAPFKPDNLDQMIFGLRINPTPYTPYADVQAMIQRSRTEGAAGHSLWFSTGVRDLYGPQLTAFYDVAGQGQADNPMFPAGHRPLPTVATAVAGSPGQWLVDVATAGRYRVVARLGAAAAWTEIAAVELEAGARQLAVPNASQVELLVDHRTASSFVGDFDGDQLVDGVDFLAWQRGLGTTLAPPTAGDSTRDGVVNGLDLPAWKLNFGLGAAAASSQSASVPEPPAAALVAVLAALVAADSARRRAAALPR